MRGKSAEHLASIPAGLESPAYRGYDAQDKKTEAAHRTWKEYRFIFSRAERVRGLEATRLAP